MPGAPCSASTSRPESSASAGRPVCCAALRALRITFSTNVSPVSSASATLKCDCGTTSRCRPASNWLYSRTLPALLLASTMVLFMWFLWQDERAKRSRASCFERGALSADQLGNAILRERGHGLHFGCAEGFAFRRALDLDEAAGLVHHEIHVGLGGGIFGIVAI